jgi:hypothetical protein
MGAWLCLLGPCSGGLGERASGVAWAEVYVLDDTVGSEGSGSGGGNSCSR